MPRTPNVNCSMELLHDYTTTSSCSNWFFGRLSTPKTHINEIEAIINDPTIKKMSELLLRLEAIIVENEQTELARIIKKIKAFNPEAASFRHCPAVLTIAAFLNNFNYIDASDKQKDRNINNEDLVAIIENIATQLRTNLRVKIKQYNNDDSKKLYPIGDHNSSRLNLFMAKVNLALKQVITAHQTYDPFVVLNSDSALEIELIKRDGLSFDDNLLKALSKAQTSLVNKEQRHTMELLLANVKNYPQKLLAELTDNPYKLAIAAIITNISAGREPEDAKATQLLYIHQIEQYGEPSFKTFISHLDAGITNCWAHRKTQTDADDVNYYEELERRLLAGLTQAKKILPTAQQASHTVSSLTHKIVRLSVKPLPEIAISGNLDTAVLVGP
ncbi:MAG: hypothetical protein ACHP65_07720 [Legionellales bacterium]